MSPRTGLAGSGATRRSAAALWRDRAGNAILEFAFVAPAFIALILAILHTSLIYMAQEGLQTAAEASTRLIATGNAQTLTIGSGGTSHLGMTATDFKSAICNGMTGTNALGVTVTYPKALPPFLACDRLAVNVMLVPAGCTNPSTVNPTYTYNASGVLTSTGTGYGQANCAGTTNSNGGLAGSQTQLAILQLMYLWPTTSGPLGLNFVNQPNGNRLMVATAVFTVEGYACPSGVSSC